MQLDLHPKNEGGHEEEHSRTSQKKVSAENTVCLQKPALLIYLFIYLQL